MLEKLKDGVWAEADSTALIHWGIREHHFLMAQATRAAKRKARLCAHRSIDLLQEMLICQGPDAQILMHSHRSPESCVLLSGRMEVHFADGRLITMERGDYLRIPAGVEHRPKPLESCVLLEITLS